MRTSVLKGISYLALGLATMVPSVTAYAQNNSTNASRPKPNQSTCAGIRGNGQNLFAHYGVLARQTEEYGAVTCAAGGSSGSITAFFLESMWANEAVQFCSPQRRCSETQRDARMSLMLKSVIGLTDAGLFEDAAIVGAVIAGISEGNIKELLEGPNPQEGADAFLRLLRDLGPLINPEAIDLLANSPDPVFHATDIIDGLEKGLQFIVDDPRVFLRTSIINFDAFASLIGGFGSFYAGYGPADLEATNAWLDACAEPGVGLEWEQVATLSGPMGVSCGDAFSSLYNEYREAFANGNFANRVDDEVGLYMPTFGVTGVLTGDAIDLWAEARAAWIAAAPIDFIPDFDDIGMGYWGQTRELKTMEKNLTRDFPDLGSQNFTPLGAVPWREVIASSPAEPGFSPGVTLTSGAVSVGGWADPLRVQPLIALGAKTTITVNRRDGVGGFTFEATRLLNASDEELAALYSTTDPNSTFYIGLDQADGVWCTDWDAQMGDPNMLFNDGFNSPLITTDGTLLAPRNGYENIGDNFPIFGCEPGIGPDD